jgi:hypothetical protein
VVLQHIHSQRDAIPEPVPGIAPYLFTSGLSINARTEQFAIIQDARRPAQSNAAPLRVALCNLPDILGRQDVQAMLDVVPKDEPDWDKEALHVIDKAIGGSVPVFRRTYIHPAVCPAQNEFTVGETISPLAALFGALLPDGWQPARTTTIRKPKMNAKDLQYYVQP